MKTIVIVGSLGLCSLTVIGCSQPGAAMPMMETSALKPSLGAKKEETKKLNRNIICTHWRELALIGQAKLVNFLAKIAPVHLQPYLGRVPDLVCIAKSLQSTIKRVVALALDVNCSVGEDQLKSWYSDVLEIVNLLNWSLPERLWGMDLMIRRLSITLSGIERKKKEVEQHLNEIKKEINDANDPRLFERVKELMLISQGPIDVLDKVRRQCDDGIEKYLSKFAKKTDLQNRIEIFFRVVNQIKDRLDNPNVESLSNMVQKAINNGLHVVVKI